MSLQRMYNLTQRQVQVPSIYCCIALSLQSSRETRARFSCNENLIALGRPPQILSGLRFTQPQKRDPFLCDTIGATSSRAYANQEALNGRAILSMVLPRRGQHVASATAAADFNLR